MKVRLIRLIADRLGIPEQYALAINDTRIATFVLGQYDHPVFDQAVFEDVSKDEVLATANNLADVLRTEVVYETICPDEAASYMHQMSTDRPNLVDIANFLNHAKTATQLSLQAEDFSVDAWGSSSSRHPIGLLPPGNKPSSAFDLIRLLQADPDVIFVDAFRTDLLYAVNPNPPSNAERLLRERIATLTTSAYETFLAQVREKIEDPSNLLKLESSDNHSLWMGIGEGTKKILQKLSDHPDVLGFYVLHKSSFTNELIRAGYPQTPNNLEKVIRLAIAPLLPSLLDQTANFLSKAVQLDFDA